jgi:hypothetical protein
MKESSGNFFFDLFLIPVRSGFSQMEKQHFAGRHPEIETDTNPLGRGLSPEDLGHDIFNDFYLAVIEPHRVSSIK